MEQKRIAAGGRLDSGAQHGEQYTRASEVRPTDTEQHRWIDLDTFRSETHSDTILDRSA